MSTTGGITKASFTTSSLRVGSSQSITAVYSGDANFTTSKSPALSQTVNQDATTTGLTSSDNPSVYGQAATFTATVAATSPGVGSPTGTVTFKDGSTTLGTGTLSTANSVTTATFTTTSLSVGSGLSITAVYSGDANFTTSTSSARFQAVNPSTATFLEKDATTQGSWSGTYGTQGHDIVSGPSSLPANDTITPSGQSTYTWTTTSSDPRALQVPGSSNRVAAAWYSSTSFSVDVNLADGQAHDLELYFLDWDNRGRSEQVQISDATTGTVLDTETISSFTSGVYLNWKISGDLVITITSLAGVNAVLNGLFLDANAPTSARRSSSRTRRRRGAGSGTYGARAMTS